jgi:hypothetical protein
MHRRGNHIIISFALAIAVSGCFRHEQRTTGDGSTTGVATVLPNAAQPMQVRLEMSRALDTVLVLEGGDGTVRTVVTSLDTALHRAPAASRLDLVQSFAWNPADSTWHPAPADSVLFGTRIDVRDVTGDTKPDLLIFTISGMIDDTIAGHGITVFAAHGSEWRPVLVLPGGDPVLRDVDNNGTMEIVTRDAYSGVMPMTDAIVYESDVYSFDGQVFTSAKQRLPKFFEQSVTSAQEAYARIKTTVPVNAPINDEFDFTLYGPCATVFVTLNAASDKAGKATFWNREKDYLSRMLPPSQFTDLEALAEVE